MRSLFKEKGATGIEGKDKTTTAQVICCLWIKECHGERTRKELRRTRRTAETLMRSGALEEEHLLVQIRLRWSAGVSLVRSG